MHSHLHLQPEEKISYTVRRHWIMLVKDAIGVVAIGLLPFFIFPFLFSIMGLGGLSTPVITFLTTAWLLIVWIMLFTIWTDYYLDLWVITDRRLIDVDQIGLFHRKVSTLRIERVQDATVRIPSFLATILGYGNVLVHTASGVKNISHMEGIPNPTAVQKIILERVDLMSDRYLPEEDELER
jgi:uncharacterized membrane protein YdbT with pleckstrin-like domain